MDDALTYFFDSYALIEVYERNPLYEQFIHTSAVTTYFHAYEVYHCLLKSGYCEEDIQEFFTFLRSICTSLDFSWIPLAVEFRSKHKKKKLSYADCIGYAAAKQLRIPFLTGDKEFEGIANVKFVAK